MWFNFGCFLLGNAQLGGSFVASSREKQQYAELMML